MTVYRLDDGVAFPPVENAEPGGLLAVGGDLRPERLVQAYASGIFPWYDEPPILWFAPEQRMVLDPGAIHVSRRLRRTLRQGTFDLTLDRAFREVIHVCAETPRAGQRGTWIVPDMIAAYLRLHDLGVAHSCEAWRNGRLVGGVYGVSLGHAFFGESMFHRDRDASKAALAALCWQLAAWDFPLFDCQLHTDHLEAMGAGEVGRDAFAKMLEGALSRPTRRGPWDLDANVLRQRLTEAR
jgi:leucyl/phenylalanyl-tRNA--protein transferase